MIDARALPLPNDDLQRRTIELAKVKRMKGNGVTEGKPVVDHGAEDRHQRDHFEDNVILRTGTLPPPAWSSGDRGGNWVCSFPSLEDGEVATETITLTCSWVTQVGGNVRRTPEVQESQDRFGNGTKIYTSKASVKPELMRLGDPFEDNVILHTGTLAPPPLANGKCGNWVCSFPALEDGEVATETITLTCSWVTQVGGNT